ncbi:MAG: arylamine N-acetyltransferase [Verrucomicrobiales bacterium]|jgi:arylamine N-acetyltransferase
MTEAAAAVCVQFANYFHEICISANRTRVVDVSDLSARMEAFHSDIDFRNIDLLVPHDIDCQKTK